MPEAISRGEATRRTAGVGALLGLALVHVTALPYSLVQGRQIAAITVAAIAAALCLACALGRCGVAGGRVAWRLAGALGVLTGVGWVLTRTVAVPGVAEERGQWAAATGLLGVVLAAALVALAAAGAGLPDARGALRTAGVSVGLVPVAAIALAAAGPPPAHHHGLGPATVLPAGHGHRRSAASPGVAAAAFRPGFGGHAGRYVYANARRPHLAAAWLALALGVAAMAASMAAGALRARSGAGGPGSPRGPDRARAASDPAAAGSEPASASGAADVLAAFATAVVARPPAPCTTAAERRLNIRSAGSSLHIQAKGVRSPTSRETDATSTLGS